MENKKKKQEKRVKTIEETIFAHAKEYLGAVASDEITGFAGRISGFCETIEGKRIVTIESGGSGNEYKERDFNFGRVSINRNHPKLKLREDENGLQMSKLEFGQRVLHKPSGLIGTVTTFWYYLAGHFDVLMAIDRTKFSTAEHPYFWIHDATVMTEFVEKS